MCSHQESSDDTSNPASSSLHLPPKHTCYCGKNFIRKEHLTRHQATHNKLGHICSVCKRGFSRKELLRRHSILHDPSHTRSAVSCDTCRANKTKCSGGPQCLLCSRRGVNCTFRNGPINIRAHADDAKERSESVLSKSSRTENPHSRDSSLLEREMTGHEWLLDATVVATESVSTSEFQSLGLDMEAIHELLIAEEPSLEGAIKVSTELQDWLTKCVQTFFESFHLRWPILNAPSFDATTAYLPLAASVCVIGAWLRIDATRYERLCALKVHKILLQRLLHKLIDPESILEGQAWPIELFQAILLTLIFSLYRSNKSALSGATLLRGVFITFVREIGAFNSELLASHLQTHFSGTYAPYTLSMREKFRRLLALTYQFDVYFALVHKMPPILHRQEIGADLTITFALWNAHGLDIFAKRLLEEPIGRTGFQISQMTNSPGSFAQSQLLVEDVLLGLCGSLQGIWVLSEPLPYGTKDCHTKVLQNRLLIETLDAWKYELDKIAKLANVENITGEAARYLLLAYRGEDETVASTLQRINTLIQDGTVLYFYLKMSHYVYLNSLDFAEQAKQTKDTCIETEQLTNCRREAFLCAVELLKIVDSVRASSFSINPLVRHALILGTALTRRVLVSCEKCDSFAGVGQRTTETGVRQWSEFGEVLYVNDTPLCFCESKFCTGIFDKAIQNQSFAVESADGDVNTNL